MPPQSVPIQQYLKQSDRLMLALIDPEQLETLEPGLFRFRMQPIKFVTLMLRPVSDIEIWSEQNTVYVHSTACRLEGQPAISDKFSLNLQGHLSSQDGRRGTQLCGQANLKVDVDLPTALRFMPKSVLKATGNGILNGILATMKQRLMRRLVADYRDWAAKQPALSAKVS
ncbi:DUF1997 domain-containing protein [Vasconcelosia minhoensis]|uniref:DUF1997 domain-containing protein n=1 Tax=Vasconcelosia minhoensis TaxID=3366354 RepID=UPI002AD21AB1|nr:DUF1997 domain-containing protein [Romeria gracilis]